MPYASATDGANIMRLFDRGIGVMTSFFSRFLFDIIIKQPARVEITVIIVFVMVLWIMVDRGIRKLIQKSILMRENRRWRDLIIEVLDFMLLLGVFLITQLLFQLLSEGIGTSEMGAAEAIVLVFIVMVGGFALMLFIREMSSPIRTNPLK